MISQFISFTAKNSPPSLSSNIHCNAVVYIIDSVGIKQLSGCNMVFTT